MKNKKSLIDVSFHSPENVISDEINVENEQNITFCRECAASENISAYTPTNSEEPECLEDMADTIKENKDILSDDYSAQHQNRKEHKNGINKKSSKKTAFFNPHKDERQRFYDLFSEAPVMMGFLGGPEHVYEMVNPLHFKLIGKDDIIGKTVSEVLPEAIEQGIVNILDEVYNTGKTFSASEMLVKIDAEGNGKFVDTYLSFMFQAHRSENQEIDGILFFAVDVTEQIILRNDIEESQASLKEVQTLLHLSTWEINLVTNVSTWSDEFYAILGVTREEMKPSAEAFLTMLHPDDLEFARAIIQKSLETFELGTLKARIIRKDGEIRFFYSEWKVEWDTDGKPIRLFGILQDTTEKIRAKNEREKLVLDLLQRNRDLEQFTFIISHNLRAPIANVIGYTEYLQDTTLSTQDKNDLLDGLASSVSGLDTIIKDINSILKVKQDINDKKEIIFFSKILADVTTSIQNRMDESEVEIKSDFTQVDEIFSLKVYMHSIFYNLISNSIKYCKPDEKPCIEIKSIKEKEKIILTFKDNCLGIDLKTKGDKIFGLYKRFHTHVEGKGLGLFMVKTQIEALGGKISVESEVNKGTKFTIEFMA